MTEQNGVLAAVRAAFPAVPVPKVVANAPGPLKAEAAAFVRTLQGKDWASVTLSDLRSDLFGIFRIDEKSYRYYLPAYLSLATTDYHSMDFVAETLLQSLASPDYGALTDDDLALLRKGWGSSPNAAALDRTLANAGKNSDMDTAVYESRMKGLSKPQLEAVKLFLDWLRQEHGDDDANSYISKAEISILELLARAG